jgi:hypothetical protein
MRKIKVLLLSNKPNDGTSFYRAWGVFPHLEKNYPIEIIQMEYGSITDQWPTIERCDIAFLQRPHLHITLETLRYCKQMGKPVVVDYDDNLFNVPPANPHYMAFMDKKTHDLVKLHLSEADMVMVSTERLKVEFSSLNKNIHVIRNAFNSDMFKYVRNRNIERQNIIMWRGGSSHAADLDKYKKEILESLNKHPELNWYFVGYRPSFLPLKSNIQPTFFSDVITYHSFINGIRPRAIYVPLEENVFNLCKSNVSYIEATMAGAVCIVPDWPEWQLPGVLKYKDNKGFSEQLEHVTDKNFNVDPYNRMAWNYICANQSLDIINGKRFKCLKELM